MSAPTTVARLLLQHLLDTWLGTVRLPAYLQKSLTRLVGNRPQGRLVAQSSSSPVYVAFDFQCDFQSWFMGGCLCLQGRCYVDESVLTGESMPVSKVELPNDNRERPVDRGPGKL